MISIIIFSSSDSVEEEGIIWNSYVLSESEEEAVLFILSDEVRSVRVSALFFHILVFVEYPLGVEG